MMRNFHQKLFQKINIYDDEGKKIAVTREYIRSGFTPSNNVIGRLDVASIRDVNLLFLKETLLKII